MSTEISRTHYMCCMDPDYRLRIGSQGYESHKVCGHNLLEKTTRTVHSAF